MKLYIAYYESYVSIIEGKYNYKKDKFNIKSCTLISSEDVDIDYNDKYSLLREALSINESKVKDVVLCLNTKDVIIKSTDTHKVKPKDLDGIMNNEMDEIMSLDYDRYTFSYEVTKEGIKDDKENLDIIVAAIVNEELEQIVGIFKEFKLNLERIDTISTAYARLLKKIEYDNIMILNTGSYGSIVNIFKEDSLFIHDNIPVKINQSSNHYVYSSLVEEIKGLINYYSSRNYGNNIDTIVLTGEGNENIEIKNSFEKQFSSNIICGIENLFDIKDDIVGDLNKYEISFVCDILGSMCIYEDKKDYSKMNLLPEKLKSKQKSRDSITKALIMLPAVIAIVCAPYIVFGAMNLKIQSDIDKKQEQLEQLISESGDVEKTKSEIESLKEEMEIYQMLSNQNIKWGELLDTIDNSIPYRADLTNINVYYDGELVEGEKSDNLQTQDSNEEKIDSEDANEESSTSDNSEEVAEEEKIPVYEQIPNVIVLEGEAKNSYHVGQFVYNLNQISYFKSVELKSTTEDKEKGIQKFNIILVLKEGAIHGE